VTLSDAVDAAWRDDVRARCHVIESVVSEDFADLQFLKPLLEGKRVVQLGESAHGVAEFNRLKVRLIKFLHRELGFDVIAFESSMSGCDVADGRVGQAKPVDVMRDSIFAVWHTKETLELFDYIERERMAGRRLSLAGFDTQTSGHAATAVTQRLLDMIGKDDEPLRGRVDEAEKRLGAGGKPLDAEEAAKLLHAYGALRDHLQSHREALRERHSARPVEVDLALQEAASRIAFVRQLERLNEDGARIRDRAMAANLGFVLDVLYPARKVVVWAHNSHIAKEVHGAGEPRRMGAYIAKRRGEEVYTVGVVMGKGIAAQNDRKPYRIEPPDEDSLEFTLASAGAGMSFVDFSRARPAAGNSWIFEPIFARSWGVHRYALVPSRAFDAMIYVDAVTPPAYL
jgi:erythromycin esterase